MPEAAKGIEKLDLLVVGDPHPTTWAVLSEPKNGTYLLPICTQFATSGSRTASNRSLQWGEQIVKPIFESKGDYEAIYMLAKKLGFAEPMFKNIKVEGDRPVPEDILREINRGGWSTGYCGQSPERFCNCKALAGWGSELCNLISQLTLFLSIPLLFSRPPRDKFFLESVWTSRWFAIRLLFCYFRYLTQGDNKQQSDRVRSRGRQHAALSVLLAAR